MEKDQDAKDILERWSKRRLLRKSGEDYRFDHESKREAILDALGGEGGSLAPANRVSLARKLFNFYLSNAGFINDNDRPAVYYPAYALRVAEWAEVAPEERRIRRRDDPTVVQAGSEHNDDLLVPEYSICRKNALESAPSGVQSACAGSPRSFRICGRLGERPVG